MNTLSKILLTLFVLVSSSVSFAGVTYYHTNHLGSPIAASDESGEVVWTKAYSPFGEEVSTGVITDNREIGYTGHQFDNDTQTNYMEDRHYDPEVARFFSVDDAAVNIEKPQSFNPYIYANNSPFRYIDPDGKSPVAASTLCGPGTLLCAAAAVGLTVSGSESLGHAMSGINWTDLSKSAQSMAIASMAGAGASKRIHVTYTFEVEIDGISRIYAGRTSGMPKAEMSAVADAAWAAAKNRLSRHISEKRYQINVNSFKLDRASYNYAAIRGREESLVRYYGGARILGGRAGNYLSGVNWNDKTRRTNYSTANFTEFGFLPDNSWYSEERPWNPPGSSTYDFFSSPEQY